MLEEEAHDGNRVRGRNRIVRFFVAFDQQRQKFNGLYFPARRTFQSRQLEEGVGIGLDRKSVV